MENRGKHGQSKNGTAGPGRQRAARPAKKAGAGAWLKRQLARRPIPIWIYIATDVLLFAVALNTFALFHHVLPRDEKSVGIVSRRAAEDQSAFGDSEPAPKAAATEVPEDPPGVFSARFADRFTDAEPVLDETGYRSRNVYIAYSRHVEPELVYYVADIYIRRIECLRTAFAKDKFGRGRWERVSGICSRLNGIIAINGDYYGGRSDGIVIRNGELYRDDKRVKRDVCVIYWDGSMEIFTPQTWNTEAAMENGAYQAWNFGPSLLDEQGNAIQTFDSEVAGRNPRTAIGYYEPGHYCFVVVDGRSKASRGLPLADFSELMHGLGCTMAYNMDGGQSAEMVVNGVTISKPYKGGRNTSDAILIVDE